MRLVMMGTGTFAEPTFAALLAGPHAVAGLVTQPDRVIGQERGSTRQTGRSLKDIAVEHNIPVFQPESINTPEGVAGLKEFAPDLLVVAAYGQILSKDVLTVPPRGGINVHASLLPKYRGAAPVAWAIYHGEQRTGVTIIRMSVALDAGDILAQEAVDIGPEETAGELESRLAQLGSKLAAKVVEQMVQGNPVGGKQDKSQVSKAPKLTKEHGLIDWNRPAPDMVNHIRAMQPWPTAYTFWHRQGQPPLRLILLKAAALADANMPALPPGQVIMQPDSARLFVAAAPGSQVEILELQPAGKRRMTAVEFLRGRKAQPGDSFGDEK
ncbi:MAG TPA: methionyl-tRNA formyltransferase [Gemmataceae bacterium]|jgi:methionyl-tRNA formyltransferase|nr:methionyl-tRNA formyltransferase [Gemmataceae bacterium]